MENRDLKDDLAKLEHMDEIFGPSNDFMRDVVLKHALKRAIAAEEENERLKQQLDITIAEKKDVESHFEQMESQLLLVRGVIVEAKQHIKGEVTE